MANTAFIHNVGDTVRVFYGSYSDSQGYYWMLGPIQKIIDRRIRSGRPEYKLDCGTWRNTVSLLTDAEIADQEARGTTMVDYLPAEQTSPNFAQETTNTDDALALDFPDPKEYDLESLGLPSVNLKGINIPVIEHFKDIKEYCINYKLFQRWYNRTQFLKAAIGKLDDFGGYDEGEFGKIIGGFSGANDDECWCIEVYDTANMTQEQLEYAVDEVGILDRGFFLKDKSGKIYFVFTDVD